MIVKYDGAQYHVNLSDKLYIAYQKAVLFLTRQNRRAKLLFCKEDLFLYTILVVSWLIFGFVSWIAGQVSVFSDQQHSSRDIIWELREPFFSSVVLAFAINSFERIREHIRKVNAQYSTYVIAMNDFQMCAEEYIGRDFPHFHPFYCRKTLEDTIDFIESKPGISVEKKVSVSLRVNLTLILERLEKVREEFIRGNIITYEAWFDVLYQTIDSAKGIITEILISDTYSNKKIADLCNNLFFILSRLREPWRVDIDRKMQILSRLSKYPENNIYDHFYYRMLLGSYKIKDTQRVVVKKKKG